jgi:hypothetical protein
VDRAEGEGVDLRFVIRLLIVHPNFDPSGITEQLKIAPTMSHAFGAPCKTPNGKLLPGTYKVSRWGWSMRVEGKRNFFEDVAQLAERLKPHKEFLAKLAGTGGKIAVIVDLPGDVNIGWNLPSAELRNLADLKVDLGIEVFPHFN